MPCFHKVLASRRRSEKAVSEELTTYDPTEGLTSDEAIETFIAEALKTEDAGFIAYANGVVARARTKDTSADGIPSPVPRNRMKAFGIRSTISLPRSGVRAGLDAPALPSLTAGAAKVAFPRWSVGTSKHYE